MALSVQQELVYERLKATYAAAIAANESMGKRAAIIVGGGTAIATLFAGGGVPKSLTISLALLIASAVASLFVFVAASFVWMPRNAAEPGTLDIDELWEGVIDETEDAAIATLINDQIAAIKLEIESNTVRSKAFRYMLIGVWFQVFLVFCAAWFRA